MNPVSTEVWLCFSLAYFSVSVVLYLSSRIVNSSWRRRIVQRPSYRSFSYPKSLNDRRKSEIEMHRFQADSFCSDRSSINFALIRRRSRYRNTLNSSNRPDLKNKNKNKSNIQHFSISNALFFTFASFMRQSINLTPRSVSGRIAATSWWYFSLIFVSSYTANLVAFLTVEVLVTPIDKVEDLGSTKKNSLLSQDEFDRIFFLFSCSSPK